MRAVAVAVLLAAPVAACSGSSEEPGETLQTTPGPTMRPGDNCLRCHREGGQADAFRWSAAGTIYPTESAARTDGVEGVTVEVTDSTGAVVETLVTNAAGNFFTDTPLPDPFFVRISHQGTSIEMPCAPPAGSCNACHSLPPVGHAPGRIYVPGAAPVGQPPFDCPSWYDGGPGRL